MMHQPYIYALTYKGIISYIGLHNGKDPYYFSGGVIPRRMGKDKFIKGILEYCTIDNIVDLEIYYIKLYNPKFNLTSGGERTSCGSKHSLSTIEKRKESFSKNISHINSLSERCKMLNSKNNPCVKHEMRCVTDGLVFDSIREAARHYGIDNSFISKHLKGVYKSVKNLTFEII